MSARPPVREQGPDHRHGQRPRRSREGPGFGLGLWWSVGTPGKWVSWAETTPLRAGGTRAGRLVVPGRPSGFPWQSKRHCDNRGKGGPRKFPVRTAARSKAGVLPQTVAPTVTLPAGRFHRQRRTSRLDRRRGFVPGRAAAFVLGPDDPGRGFFSSIAGSASFLQRGTPSGFFGGVLQLVPVSGTAPGFSSPARPGSSPFRRDDSPGHFKLWCFPCRGDSLDHRRGPNHPRAWWPLFHPSDEASAWMTPSRRRGPNRLR